MSMPAMADELLDAANDLLRLTEPPLWEPPLPFPEGERPDWPDGVLRGTSGRLVAELAHSTQTPRALAGMLTLAALAAVCAKRVVAVPRRGWREPVNLYTLCLLGPAERKSAVVDAVAAPLTRWQTAEVEAQAIAIALASERRDLVQKRLDKTKNKAAAEDDATRALTLRAEVEDLTKQLQTDPDLQVPASPRLLVDDITPEKLADMMAEQGGRMAVLSAEGGIFQTAAGRYSEGKADGLDLFLKGHAGETFAVDRIGRAAKSITKPALTLGMAVQPMIAQGLIADRRFRGTGFVARFLYAAPLSTVGARQIRPEPMSETTVAAWDELITNLLRLPALAELDGTPKGHDLLFSSKADDVVARFEAAREPRLGPDGDLHHIRDWAGKLHGAIVRIAALLHATESVERGEVPWASTVAAETVERAVLLAEAFLIPHALTAFGAMGADPATELAKKMLRVLARWPEPVVSRRDLHQRCFKHQVHSPDELEPGFRLLVEHGYVRPVELEKRQSGRPSRRWEINPIVRSDAGQNPQNPQNPSIADPTDALAPSFAAFEVFAPLELAQRKPVEACGQAHEEARQVVDRPTSERDQARSSPSAVVTCFACGTPRSALVPVCPVCHPPAGGSSAPQTTPTEPRSAVCPDGNRSMEAVPVALRPMVERLLALTNVEWIEYERELAEATPDDPDLDQDQQAFAWARSLDPARS